MYSVAIIGSGSIASNYDKPDSEKILTHAHAISRNDHFELRGFFDVDQNAANNAVTKWGGKSFESIFDLANNVDVCICCVPDKQHYSVIKELISHNPKLIITEKPLADSFENGNILRELSFARVPIAVNYSRRYIGEYRDLKKRLISFGKLIKGTAFYGKGTFHNGSHIIDLLRFLIGDIDDAKRTGIDIDDYDNDTTYDAILQIEDAYVYLIGVDSRKVTTFEIDLMFENARLRIVDGGQRIEIFLKKSSDDYNGYYNYKLSELIDVDYSHALCGLYDNAFSFLSGRENLFCSIDDGLEVLRICNRIKEG